MIFTYQTRLLTDERDKEILQECASWLSAVERSLYAEVAKGEKVASCKNHFLKIHKITARQFNACRVSLEGKIAACQATQEQALVSLKQQIGVLDQQIKCLEKKPSKCFTLHQKKRRRNALGRSSLFQARRSPAGANPSVFWRKKTFSRPVSPRKKWLYLTSGMERSVDS